MDKGKRKKKGKDITVEAFAQGADLTCTYAGRGNFTVSTSDTNHPAMQFAGYFDHFAHKRIQMFGHQEMGYVGHLAPDTLMLRAKEFFAYPLPCIVICNGDEVPKWLTDTALEAQVPIFKSERSTSTVVQHVVTFLDDILAPEITVHANFVDVHNVGVLLRGESGLGKSELSLELVKRGHVLVADDVTMVKKTALRRLAGFAPDATRGLLEIRGLGIMDIRRIYGSATVLDRKDVQIIIDMEIWEEDRDYDRLGFDTKYETILGVDIPRYIMPVRPGRNLAVVVEATAMDYRMKRAGFDIEKEIFDRFRQLF